jgi:hypothetical protein
MSQQSKKQKRSVKKMSMEEQRAIYVENITKKIRKEIKKDCAGTGMDIEEQVKQNVMTHMATRSPFPHPMSPYSSGSKRASTKRQVASSRDSNSPTGDICAEGPDVYASPAEYKRATWRELLCSRLKTQGFVLPILYRTKTSACNTVTFAIPCMHPPANKSSDDDPKLDFSRWVFPGFSVSRDGTACYFCSCCAESASIASSSALAVSEFSANPKLMSPRQCDCMCATVVRHIIGMNELSLEQLCNLAPAINALDIDDVNTRGLSLGCIDRGQKEIIQFGCSMHLENMGLVVAGKCVTCKSRSNKCSHARQYNAHHGDKEAKAQHTLETSIP